MTSLVDRAPLKNHRGESHKGVVRMVVASQPDVDRAEKEVLDSDKGQFSEGKQIKRSSVYAPNTSGVANKRGGKVRGT